MFKKKENKNVSRDKLGHKVGTVYINKEKIENLALRKRKVLNNSDILEIEGREENGNSRIEESRIEESRIETMNDIL